MKPSVLIGVVFVLASLTIYTCKSRDARPPAGVQVAPAIAADRQPQPAPPTSGHQHPETFEPAIAEPPDLPMQSAIPKPARQPFTNTRMARMAPERRGVYIKCGMADEMTGGSSPYDGMSFATKLALAETAGHGMQGCVAWQLLNWYMVNDDAQRIGYYVMLASLALDSPEPFITNFENHWATDIYRAEGVPYLLYAESRWPSYTALTKITSRISSEQRKEAQDKYAEIVEFARHMETAHLGM